MGDVESLSQGLGSGLASQVDSITGLIESPVETSRQMYQGVKALAQNPSVIPGLLRDAYQGATSGPMGFGEFVGANVGLRPRTPKSLLDMTVYHGSPHDFDRFDMSKIGTGEGAQAYGHGLYVAESPDVAKTYRFQAGATGFGGTYAVHPSDVEKLRPLIDGSNGLGAGAIEDVISGIPPNDVKRGLQSMLKMGEIDEKELSGAMDALSKAESLLANRKGALYTVDLPDSAIANMLDWDAPLSQQPESVRKALRAAMPMPDPVEVAGGSWRVGPYRRKTLAEASEAWANKHEFTGTGAAAYQELATALGGQEKASAALASAGVPGLRYLDGGSRQIGNGTRNYVVFDDKLLKILKKE